MDNLGVILSLIGTAIALLATTITFIYKFIVNLKAKNLTIKDLNLLSMMPKYIQEAEKFINYSGEEKLEYVLTRLNQYAVENNIPFDKHSISMQIEELITLTKKVNNITKD